MQLGQLRACERQQEQGNVPHPGGEVGDDLELCFVCPVDVLADEDGRALAGEPLDEASRSVQRDLLVGGRLGRCQPDQD